LRRKHVCAPRNLSLGLLPWPVAFRVTGPNLEKDRAIATQVQAAMLGNPHTRQVNQDWGERAPTVHFVLDQARLQLIGLSSGEAAEQIQFLLTGAPVIQVREDIRTADIVARSAGTDRFDPTKLNDMTLMNHTGKIIPLSQVALKFIELGNEVIVTGRRESVLDEVKKRHPKLDTIQSDVADPAQIATLATRMKIEFPKLDILMNNAGIMLHRNLTAPTADLAGLMTEINVNVGGVVIMTSAFIDILRANKGTVINTSSAVAFVPLPSAPIYSATKPRFTPNPVAAV
jgi:hypothetical protein